MSTELDRLFDECNQRYFRGRKPKYRVRLGFHRDNPAGNGYCDTARRIIWLGSPDRATLLHEMCHIGCPSHGKQFQARLRALGEAGETWAAEEARLLAEAIPWIVEIAGRVGDVVMENPGITYRQLVRGLAAEGRTTQALLQRRLPWLRARYRRCKAKWDAFYKADAEQRRLWNLEATAAPQALNTPGCAARCRGKPLL